ncbi:MAG: extensin family protein [Pseudomonadota bacterium]|nr:extensin family protein [Pseudomonadota bacterium]
MPSPSRIGCWLLLALLALAAWFGWREYQRLVRDEPERFPWTPLALSDPIGPFTGRKLSALASEPARCEALLGAIGSGDRVVAARRPAEAACGYDQAIELRPADSDAVRYGPAGLVTACPVAAAMALWERDVVQPAAQRIYGERVARVDHFGSYSCRRLYGRGDGAYSEHATANAVDIAGFRLVGGRRITVLGNWNDPDRDAAFLREVRSGACDLFATVLSPDYNAAHADHFHFDQAMRGATGWRGCR